MKSGYKYLKVYIELYNFGPLTITANLDLDNLQKGIFNITFALVSCE